MAEHGRDAELAVRLWEAVNRRDLPALVQICDAQVELESALGGTYRGRSGLESWWSNLFEAVDHYEGTVEGALDLGGLVLAFVRVDASGQRSGMEGTRRVLQVFTIRDGKIARLAVHPSVADGLDDAAAQFRSSLP